MTPAMMLMFLVQLGACTPPVALVGPGGQTVMAIVCPLPGQPADAEDEAPGDPA